MRRREPALVNRVRKLDQPMVAIEKFFAPEPEPLPVLAPADDKGVFQDRDSSTDPIRTKAEGVGRMNSSVEHSKG